MKFLHPWISCLAATFCLLTVASEASVANRVSAGRSSAAEDDLIIESYNEDSPWGMSVSIDLYGCDNAMIQDEKVVAEFLKQIVPFIGMKAYGEPLIKNFGPTPRLEGISAVQLIETSDITAHFAPANNSAHIDIFSCKAYRPHASGLFCKKFFKAEEMMLSQVTFRY